MMNFLDVMMASLEKMGDELAVFAPRMLLAIAILLLGWIVAKLLKAGGIKVLRAIRVDEAAEKAGIEDFLLRGGVRFTTVTLLAELFYWLVFFATVFFALDILGLTAAQELLRRIILYIPQVFIAVIILIFGSLVGKFAKALLHTYLNNVGFSSAQGVSTIAQYAIMAFVVFVALEQLSIGGEILVSAFQISFAGLALAFGLAFGLGGTDVAKRIAEKLYKSFGE